MAAETIQKHIYLFYLTNFFTKRFVQISEKKILKYDDIKESYLE